MSSSVRLGLMAGIFVAGGFGGAALQVSSSPVPPNEQRSTSNAPAPRQEQRALDLEELRTALTRLGWNAQSSAPAQATVPASQAPVEADAPVETSGGEAASDILRRLEEDYRASLQRKPAEAKTALLSAAPADVSIGTASPELQREALGAATDGRDVAAPGPSVGQTREPGRFAQAEPPASAPSDVHYGDTNVTTVHQTNVQETHINQTAIAYQQLLLLAPQGVPSSRSPSPAPQRRPGISPQDSNPWASVDYGSHYANPWGSSFSGRP